MLPVSIVVAAVMISGSILYVVGSKKQAPEDVNQNNQNPPVSIELSDQDVVLGNPEAPVTIIEYGDYQCPWCGKFFTDTEGPLRDQYIGKDKVRMAYRNFAFLSPESFAAAEAAECAKDQNKFWAFHDELFLAEVKDGQEHNGNLNRDLFLEVAGKLGLDVAAFTSCFDTKKYTELIKQQYNEARAAGVGGTPAVFLNGKQVGNGYVDFETLKSVIDSLLVAE